MLVRLSTATRPAPRTPLRALAGAVVISLLLTVTPMAQAQTAPTRMPLGLDISAVDDAKALGAPPAYGSFWVGKWMARHGWAGLDNALTTAKAEGVTPIIYWYYWGDGISPSCVENGCEGESKAQWFEFTTILAGKVRTHMGGKPVVIVLENEFNKGGIADSWYAPTFDGYLERVAKELKAVSGVKLVLGFGAWGESQWTNFPKAAAQSDYIGFQLMRGSTRHSEAQYRDAAGAVSHFTGHIARTFNKPSFLYDLALSSYPDAHWQRVQAETLSAVFDQIVQAGQTGLQGVVYRSLKDHYMDPSNYFGAAESHWGLRFGDNRPKPAWDVWHAKANAIGGTTPPPPPPPASVAFPASVEGEAMSATTGGKQGEPSASGGAVWNIWTNGELKQPFTSDGGAHRVTVVARGSSAGGVWPAMELRVDGARVGGATVASGTLAPHAFDVTLPAQGTLSVAFTNDALVNGQDRNLYVDVVRVDRLAQNRAPSAAFTAAASGLSVSVDASGSSDPDGDALAYAWSFGDGATATGVKAQHDYAAGGTYAVTLTVSDGKASATSTRAVTIPPPNRAPTATFAVSGSAASWAFDASASSDPDGDALAYAWSFGDGATATGVKAQHDYARAGDYTVTLRVTDARGLSATSTAQVKAAPAPFAAAFSGVKGNDWWVQVDVDANRALSGVCASVDGGACRALAKQSWGSWAASFYVPRGADVTFRATATTGESLASGAYDWPSGTPVPATPPFTATFTPHDGNEWWVQARVDANRDVKAVCASVNGGACQPLALRSWGSWAASFHVPTGAKVVFQATATDGSVARSPAYAWPVR